MLVLLVWIGLSLPMAFVVGHILRGSSAPVPADQLACAEEAVIRRVTGGGVPATALAKEAVEPIGR